MFTIYYVFPCLLFFFFSLLHAIWEVWITKVPEQIACILACIAVWYLHPIYRLELRREGSTIHFLWCVSFTFLGWRTKSSLIPICRVHRTCTWNKNVLLVWRKSVVLFLINEKGIAQFCNRLRLWPVLLHCITQICLFWFFLLCLYCAPVSEHRGLEKVNLRC